MRILIVDDLEVIRCGLRNFFEDDPTCEVIGEVNNGSTALYYVRQYRPDVILIDPGTEDIDYIRSLQYANPCARIILFTTQLKQGVIQEAMNLGAAGYLHKNASQQELLHAVHTVYMGEMYFSSQVTACLVHAMRFNRKPSLLTERELEVLDLLAQGYSNKAIASALYIGEKTVKTHVSNILGKLNLTSRTQAALYAASHDLREVDTYDLVPA